jgi:hypothetical protein
VQVNITRQQAQTGPHVLNAAGLPIVESSGQRGSLWWLEINVTVRTKAVDTDTACSHWSFAITFVRSCHVVSLKVRGFSATNLCLRQDNGIGIASATQLGVFDSSKRSQGGVGTGTSGRFGVGLIGMD